jgi:thioester reductase-like protein
MSSKTIFMTGFPGYLAHHLVDRIARRDDDAEFVFLIEERLRARAEQSIEVQEEKTPGFRQRTELLAGDITAGPHLGLGDEELEKAQQAEEVWHLAAIYNLAIELPAAYRVNVTGTSNVLDFCESVDDLKRLSYVSTCYVSGNRTGRILESELDAGQTFKNNYESTKCWAEIEVRRRLDRIPTTIFRPGIVIGDSRTGETDKYDGPYYLIRGLLKLPQWVPVPFVGRGEAVVNITPIDFTVDAMAEISANDLAKGKTYQLADPNPHTSHEILEEIARLTGHSTLPVSLPAGAVEAVARVRQVEEILQIPTETITYFNHQAVYDTSNTDELLEDTPVTCPDLMSYLPVIVDYVRRNPHKAFLDSRRF